MKILLTTVLSFISLMAFSQVSLKKLDGTVINDGDILTYGSLSEPGNYLGLKIYNSSNEDITVKVKVVSFTNASGGNLQLCVDPVCVNNLIIGNSYPNFGSVIPANGSNGNFDHFKNETAGTNPANVVDYTLKLFIIDENELEIGNSITFTYRYSPNLSTSQFDDLSSIGVKQASTLVSNNLEFAANNAIKTSVYDVSGKLLFKNNFPSGNNSINMSALSSGIYIINYTNQEGKKASVKFIKK